MKDACEEPEVRDEASPPTLVTSIGTKYWGFLPFQEGYRVPLVGHIPDSITFHREGGPAIITAFGDEFWYKNGQLHHDHDEPAITLRSWCNNQEWWLNGQLHRENGPAIIRADGREEWYWIGQLHRTDGPAVIHPNPGGSQEWFQHGLRHRIGGPAVIRPEGNGIQEWWQYGDPFNEDGTAIFDEI